MNNYLGGTNYLGSTADRLADELFLIAHDDYTGKPIAAANLLDSTLAGAVLAELILDGRITITHDRVYATDRRTWHEPVTDLALDEILRHGDGHPTRTWLEFLSPQAREQVGDRLVRADAVRRESTRGLDLRTSVRWPGTDPNRAAKPRIRLAAILERADRPLDAHTATLAALIRAGGVIRALALHDKAVLERIASARHRLSPELGELLTAVDAAIAAAALTVGR